MVEELGRRKVNDGVKFLQTYLIVFTKLNWLYVGFNGNGIFCLRLNSNNICWFEFWVYLFHLTSEFDGS